MVHAFDAAQEAVKVETMARDFMHTGAAKAGSPIEQNPIYEHQKSALAAEMTSLYSNPEHLKAVGKEFEKSNSTIFSLMPNIDITADENGYIESLHFTPAFLDIKGRGSEFFSTKDAPVYSGRGYEAPPPPSLGDVPFPMK